MSLGLPVATETIGTNEANRCWLTMKTHVPDRIVAVGLLTQRDLDVLGTGFRRLFPIDEAHPFTDLLEALDGVEEQWPSAQRT